VREIRIPFPRSRGGKRRIVGGITILPLNATPTGPSRVFGTKDRLQCQKMRLLGFLDFTHPIREGSFGNWPWPRGLGPAAASIEAFAQSAARPRGPAPHRGDCLRSSCAGGLGVMVGCGDPAAYVRNHYRQAVCERLPGRAGSCQAWSADPHRVVHRAVRSIGPAQRAHGPDCRIPLHGANAARGVLYSVRPIKGQREWRFRKLSLLSRRRTVPQFALQGEDRIYNGRRPMQMIAVERRRRSTFLMLMLGSETARRRRPSGDSSHEASTTTDKAQPRRTPNKWR